MQPKGETPKSLTAVRRERKKMRNDKTIIPHDNSALCIINYAFLIPNSELTNFSNKGILEAVGLEFFVNRAVLVDVERANHHLIDSLA